MGKVIPRPGDKYVHTKLVSHNDILQYFFFHLGNMDEEISPTKYEGWIIKPDETATIHACGREASPSGTTGEFNLIDTMGGHTIRHFYWDCPWGSSGNVWRLSERNPQWMVDSEGENLGEGPLGVISVNVFNIN